MKKRRKRTPQGNVVKDYLRMKLYFDNIFENLKEPVGSAAEEEDSVLQLSKTLVNENLLTNAEIESEMVDKRDEKGMQNVKLSKDLPMEILNFRKLHTVREMEERLDAKRKKSMKDLKDKKEVLVNLFQEKVRKEKKLKELIQNEKYLNEDIDNLRDQNSVIEEDLNDVTRVNETLEKEYARLKGLLNKNTEKMIIQKKTTNSLQEKMKDYDKKLMELI